MTIILRIIGFHNCHGCSQKVRTALRRIGVELVELDRENGIVTIATTQPPEVIRYALERQLRKSVVVVSGELVPTNQTHSLVEQQPRVVANRALDLQELGNLDQVMLRLAEVLDGVEITSSNTIRINLIHRENPPLGRRDPDGYVGVRTNRIRDVDDEYTPPRMQPRSPPWVATEPTAPLMPTEEQVVYGYPPDYYGNYSTRNHDNLNGCCNIL